MQTTSLTETQFGQIADRWLPLIYKGAIEYQIPGKFDAEDLVQEGLRLLFEEINKRVINLQRWEVDSNDFEKYFKSALFHRFVDLKRAQGTKKRDYKKEVHATDDYDPIENLVLASGDNSEYSVLSDDIYQQLHDRLTDVQQQVLECLVHTPEVILKSVREHRCDQCLYMGDPTPDGKCPDCIKNGFETTAMLDQIKSPSRMLQSEIQNYLGMNRTTVTDAIYAIRQTIKTLSTTPDKITLKAFMDLFGYGDKPWPVAMTCCFEEGTPVRQHLTYYSLREIMLPDEVLLMDFMSSHTNSYYTKLRFTDMARRMNISVHRLREAVDSIRIKLELIEAGVPLSDVPRSI